MPSPACPVKLIPGTAEPVAVAVMVDGVQTSTPNDNFYPIDTGVGNSPTHPAIDSYCHPYRASHGTVPAVGP